MNRKRWISLCVLWFMLCALFSISARAESLQFKTEAVSEEEYARLVKSLDLHVLGEEPLKHKIICFDVDKDGRIALGLESLDQKYIYVLDPMGAFQFAIGFTSNGTFDLAWDGRDIILFLVRGNIAITVDQSGAVRRAEIVENTYENDRRWRDTLSASSRLMGENQYQLRKNLDIFNGFSSGFSQLVVTNTNGASTVLYDASESVLAGAICWSALVLAFFLICFVVVKEKKSRKKDE